MLCVEFWHSLPVISEIVDHVQKCFAISVQENVTFRILLQHIFVLEHFRKKRPSSSAEDLETGSDLMGTANVERDYLVLDLVRIFLKICPLPKLDYILLFLPLNFFLKDILSKNLKLLIHPLSMWPGIRMVIFNFPLHLFELIKPAQKWNL